MAHKSNSLDVGFIEDFFEITKREIFYGFKNLSELETVILE